MRHLLKTKDGSLRIKDLEFVRVLRALLLNGLLVSILPNGYILRIKDNTWQKALAHLCLPILTSILLRMIVTYKGLTSLVKVRTRKTLSLHRIFKYMVILSCDMAWLRTLCKLKENARKSGSNRVP